MKKEYLELTIEELAEDRDFIAWVLHGTHQNQWDLFLIEHPDFKLNANEARRIIKLLRDRPDWLSDKECETIWKRIEHFENHTKSSSGSFSVRNVLRYAAALIILLSVGAGCYWVYYTDHPFYQYAADQSPVTDNRARLYLSDGTTVDLEKKNSSVALDTNQHIVIDNEKVFDLSQANKADELKMNEVFVPFGTKTQLVLEDGTKVWLNAGSRMAFPTKFSQEKRTVFLEGEAYFEVAHHNDRPFFVNTSKIIIKVLGTKFNISAYNADQVTETVLVEGKVTVSEQSVLGFIRNKVMLKPNQKASFYHDDHSMDVKNEPDIELAIAWIDGWFKFSQQNLSTVLDKLERYYNVDFVFNPEILKADLITGKLDLKESVEKVMTALSDVSAIQYRIEGDKIYVEKKL